MARYRIRVRQGDVQLLVFDGERLIDTFHFVCWYEILKWEVIK